MRHGAHTLLALCLVTAAVGSREGDDGVCSSKPTIWDKMKGLLPGRCPKVSELQNPQLAQSFNFTKFEGMWYEIAHKDLTQPRFCGCTTSSKRLVSPTELRDKFSITCMGITYDEDLIFYTTNTTGQFDGVWNRTGIRSVVFPDTVVDVMEGPEADDPYRWVIEFQCVEKWGITLFFGINFYARSPDAAQIPEMERAARARGLGLYMDIVRPMHVVDHANCKHSHDHMTPMDALPNASALGAGTPPLFAEQVPPMGDAGLEYSTGKL